MIPGDYPRPRLYRSSWQSLNGPWEFNFCEDCSRTPLVVLVSAPCQHTIQVPFAPETNASGVEVTGRPRKFFYRRQVDLPANVSGQRIVLHFGAVDYVAEVWIDNKKIGSHSGGYAPFSFDLTPVLGRKRHFSLAVTVTDETSAEQPRGKQAEQEPFACWYTAVSGIWQEVWLEFVPEVAIESITARPGPDSGTTGFDVRISRPEEALTLSMEVSLGDAAISRREFPVSYPVLRVPLELEDAQTWSPATPNLYYVRFTLNRGNEQLDSVETYTAFRTIALRQDGLYLNGKRYFQKLILMQGYWEGTGYTPPDSGGFERDIQAARAMGFNGCRMHMKFEDPRFYYAADRHGFLVWEEAPAFFHFSERARSAYLKMWVDMLRRNAHHPSIVVRVLCNESWGIGEVAVSAEMQNWLRELFQLVKEIDPGRPLVANDGWEHVISDIITFHTYEHTPEALRKEWQTARKNGRCGIERKVLWITGSPPKHLPWVLSEFGGITYLRAEDSSPSWGYQDVPPHEEALKVRLRAIFAELAQLDGLTGWCYTQFSDIEQEKNGLLYSDRSAKIDPAWIRSLVADFDPGN